ncbi:SAM-dependent methyltransferase [Leifsonia virtsii]|uniref:SAM-dependent methyltransferase n=1 Tax=Leifsonia virtsii TaxID=3035915 RepID=A0ABT8J3H6_9MICO|nr:SAM-dependent methyltransferase [Leifsonia virtsii]MDN4599147.1 SAM-dependent methyltransferase [Leifsonia virtsii]
MSGVIEVSSDWLALREAEDAAARSAALAGAAAALLPAGPVTVHDLGSGTGSMARWLAPWLPGPQTWVLHDWNADLTAQAAARGIPCDREGRPATLRPSVEPLHELTAADLHGASLVTASALLDVLTAEEAHAIVDACVAARAPALLALSVTGEVALRPRHPLDRRVAEAFNAHQRREVDGRRLLGPYAGRIVEGLFRLAGWNVRRAITTWRLSGRDPQLLSEWFEGRLAAAEEQEPPLRSDAAAYRGLRRSQQRRGELSAVVYHLDLLAWPR